MATILVVDDEDLVLRLVSTMLRSAGHRPSDAHNGLEAISLFRSYPDRFDLVITDMKMPTLDGLQLIKLIRETRRDMRIICMSGFTETCPTGVHFLTKPFLPRQLLEAVEQTLTPA